MGWCLKVAGATATLVKQLFVSVSQQQKECGAVRALVCLQGFHRMFHF